MAPAEKAQMLSPASRGRGTSGLSTALTPNMVCPPPHHSPPRPMVLLTKRLIRAGLRVADFTPASEGGGGEEGCEHNEKAKHHKR